MTLSRFAILDPAAGISGDMLLGALLDAGAPRAWVEELPARLGLDGVTVGIERVSRCGVACTRASVRLGDGRTELPSPDYIDPHTPRPAGAGAAPAQPHGHDHAADGAGHRHLPELLGIIERAPLSSWVRERAGRAFRLLCEAEGKTHGVPADAVALHELGAVDAVVDIVGGIEGFERLGIDRVFTRPVALGNGWIRTAHGVIAVPAPVTTRLLERCEIGPDGPVVGEATTPTGAVLLRVLAQGAPPVHYRPVRTAWGAGGRDPEHYPNALRLLLAEDVSEAAQVVTVSSDVDDLSPEYVDPLRDALVAAGALDVQVWPIQMKKGRPGFRIEAVCAVEASEQVVEAFFLHSTTAGVRYAVADRVTLPRRQIQVLAAEGRPVAVKVLETPRGPRVKAEFEDVRRVANELGRPALEVAREVETAARAQVANSGTGTSRSRKEQ